MKIFKKKKKTILNLIKRAADFAIFNISYRYYYYNKKTLWWTILAFLLCGLHCNSIQTITTERWKLLETKTKNWKGLGKFGNVLECTDWEKQAEVLHVKDVTSHSNLSVHFSNFIRERRKKMLKKLQRSLINKICRKMSVNHHHLNVYDLKLVNLYIKRINAFGVWKVFTKKSYSKKLSNRNKYQLLRDGGNLKDTQSTSKMNCCVFNYLSLLKLCLLFQTHLLLIWCILFHVGKII